MTRTDPQWLRLQKLIIQGADFWLDVESHDFGSAQSAFYRSLIHLPSGVIHKVGFDVETKPDYDRLRTRILLLQISFEEAVSQMLALLAAPEDTGLPIRDWIEGYVAALVRVDGFSLRGGPATDGGTEIVPAIPELLAWIPVRWQRILYPPDTMHPKRSYVLSSFYVKEALAARTMTAEEFAEADRDILALTGDRWKLFWTTSP